MWTFLIKFQYGCSKVPDWMKDGLSRRIARDGKPHMESFPGDIELAREYSPLRVKRIRPLSKSEKDSAS